ncbi:HPr kinase [Spirosoma linguale]|uniref:HPr kinase n=1 Tax=Spirosoma linguale (strain ATCC 33905 / DSM 74 / LMG 10896 / Claus 1) TaxID=504472 RepID=D2QCP7_SPILD|nr:HPr kinase [Spirosoma linguale DSM 74]
MKKYVAFGLTLETELDFTDILQESTAETDVQITETVIYDQANRPTRVHRRGVQARFGRTATTLLLNWPGIATFQVSSGNKITYQNQGTDKGTLRLFLLSEIFGLLLYQRGIFLLHGSAVKVGTTASVFVGVPGAGKSTTAAAFGQVGHTVLTDDLVAIQLINNRPFVIPAFAQYKIWRNTVDGLKLDESKLEPSFEGATKFLVTQPLADFPNSPIPLQRITLLYPPKARRPDEPIKPLRSPVELLKHFPLPVQLLTGDFLQTHFRDSLAIAQYAAIYQQKRPNGFDALNLFVKSYSDRYLA